MAVPPDSKGGPPPIERAATVKLFSKETVDRLVSGVKDLFSPSRPSMFANQENNQEPWFGPGKPLQPVAPRDDVAGRAYDFPTAVNITSRPRSYEPISFPQLRGLADGWDMLRLAVETRKDQMAKLEWSILPRKRPDESFRRRSDAKCRQLEAFFRKPDRIHHWPDWVRILMEDQLVLDAPAVFLRRDQAGRPWALEIIDGATITPLLDGSGRRPMAPDPAYTQVLKGVPAIHYTADELMYFPRNPRSHKIYGMSPVEQIVMTINVGIRRQVTQLEHYTSGNVPDALIGVPETWSSQQIMEFQRYWDVLMETATARRKAKFVPGGLVYQPTRGDTGQMDPFDEWLARVVCYAFSLPPLPFVRMMNRATAQTSYETALEEGLAPMMTWLKNAIDDMICEWFGEPDYEIVWDNIRKLDQAEQINLNLQLMQRGIKSLDEIRAEMGLEPVGLGHVVFGVGPQGFMSPQDMQKSIDMGLTLPQPPMSPDMMGGGMPMDGGGDPGLLGGVPNDLLAHVGLNPDGSTQETGAPPVGPIAGDFGNQPGMGADEALGDEEDDDGDIEPGAVHPEVSDVLRQVEAMHGLR